MEHGKASTYTNWRCRCDECREAWRIYHGQRMKDNPQYRVAQRKNNAKRYWESTEEYQEYWRQQRRQRIESNLEFLRDYKEKNPCLDCGEHFPARAMDLHHRDPSVKKGTVGRMASGGVSRKVLIEEIEKCDLLCAIHHRLRH